MILKRLFSRTPLRSPERRVYEAIVAQARHPWAYAELAVPDTLDGRFDMIALHADAVVSRLSGEGAEADRFAQELVDELFRDMDRSLREMGVGDLGIGKRVKTMASVYYGRARAYADALAADAGEAGPELAAAISRNVYAGADGREAEAARLARYAVRLRRHLAAQPAAAIVAGEVDMDPGPEAPAP